MKQDLSDLQLHDDTLDRFLSESWLATFHGDNENLKQTANVVTSFNLLSLGRQQFLTTSCSSSHRVTA